MENSHLHQHQQVPLPPPVDHMINQICEAQSQPQPGVEARRSLAGLPEQDAVEILSGISKRRIRYSFDRYILYMVNQHLGNNGGSNSSCCKNSNCDSPVKRLCFTPPLQQSQTIRTCSPASITPTCLMMSPSISPSSTQSQYVDPVVRSPSSVSLQECDPAMNAETSSCLSISPQLEALGELEFRKAFLILSYLGGNRLEDFTSADKIREWKNKPMSTFEAEVWKAFGLKYDYIKEKDRAKSVDWDSGKTHIYHCHVLSDGSYRFKGPYLSKLSNFLQRTLGDDNVLLVKFAEEVTGGRNLAYSFTDYFAKYQNIVRKGIIVGLRCYRFFVFKDGGKEEKRKDPTTSPVKCFFVRMESAAFADKQGYILHGKTVREARSLFMHADNLSSLSNYMARFSLLLSKTIKLEVDLSTVNVERTEDIPCRDKHGNNVFDKDGKPLIHTDGTGFISEDLALKCPKNVTKGSCMNAGNFEAQESHRGNPPLLIQFRLFNNGTAVKGTFLLNKKLPSRTVVVRPSMIKVETDKRLLSSCTQNSLEIVGTSNQPRKTYLSKYLIALLSYGGVPTKFFMDILDNALEDAHGVFASKRAALRAAINYAGMDDNISARMILSGIPLEETYLQSRLLVMMNEEKKSLRAGKLPLPDSYYLMGTADPTGLLESDEVCIILDNGHLSGKVLVYRNPGMHFGDIHILKAKYVEKLQDFVGNAKYAIFFPTKGPRSLGDEIAGGDFDGDLYFVSRNPQLLEYFKQGQAWTSASSTYTIPSKKPSEFADEELEDELFKLFLRNRFQPSHTVGAAADSWLAITDRLLTLGDDCIYEKDQMLKNLNCLIDVYYDALDAPKKGGRKIEVPKELQAELFPHYMERKEEISYKSTSVLGLIYDKVKSYEERDLSPIEVWKLPCFYAEVPRSCHEKWKPLYAQYRINMSDAMNLGKELRDEAANEVIKTYKKILYEAPEYEQSPRRRKEIFDEACAIYQITYDYAYTTRKVSLCNFPWKVAGTALCQFYMFENQQESPLTCSLSALKDIFG